MGAKKYNYGPWGRHVGDIGGIASHAGTEDELAGSSRGNVGAMAVNVSGRAELNGPVDAGAIDGGIGVVAFGKGESANELML